MKILPKIIMLPFSEAEFFDCYGFKKYFTNHDEGEPTGRVLGLHLMKFPVAIIDIDFQGQTEDYKDKVISELIAKLPPNTVVTQTAHKGLHIYCKHKLFLNMNRYVKIVKTDTFDLDFFVAGLPNKKSYIVCPPTRVIDSETHQELQYKFILNDFNVPDLPDLDDVVNCLNIFFDMAKFKEFMQKYAVPYVPKPRVDPPFVNRQLMDKIVAGIKDFEIIEGDADISNGISIGYLIKAINSFKSVKDVTKDDIKRYFEIIASNNKLPANIDFNSEIQKYKDAASSWNCAAKILKLYRKDYNKDVILPITQSFTRHQDN